MAPGPVYAFTLTALAEFIVGLPGVVGYLATYVLLADRNNPRIALQAHGKQMDVPASYCQIVQNLAQLVPHMVGFNENQSAVRKPVTISCGARQQHPLRFQALIKPFVRNTGFE